MSAEPDEMTEVAPDGDLVAQLTAINGVRQSIKQLQNIETSLKTSIQKWLEDNSIEIASVGGKRAVSWKATTTARLDQQKLAHDYPDVRADCIVHTESRRLVVSYTPEDAAS